MLGPAALVFAVGCVISGSLSHSLAHVRGPSGDVTDTTGPAFTTVFEGLGRLPERCVSGETDNDFQRSQCSKYWDRLILTGGYASIPLLLSLAFLYLGLDALRGTYRRGQKRMEKGQALMAGTVTNPAELPADAYSWFFCFRPISIELKNKTQLKVYVPLDSPIPRPGETLAVFDGGRGFGQKRLLASIYAPHVAIVSGGT